MAMQSGPIAEAGKNADDLSVVLSPSNYTPEAATVAGHLEGIGTALAAMLSDVYLARSDSNTVSLGGVAGTSKTIWVQDVAVDCSTPKTLDTDGAAEFVITGTTTVAKGGALSTLATNNYNAYGIHYLYLCNQNACWEFASYDRKGELIMSAEAPVEAGGYLAASGDGLNARHVGWLILGSSRTMLTDYYLASAFNQHPTTMFLSGDHQGGITSSGAEGEVVFVDNTSAGDPRLSDYIVIPNGWKITCDVRALVMTQTAFKHGYYRVYGDDGFEAFCGCQILAAVNCYYGTAGGLNGKTYSADTVVFLKTQTGCQKVSGASGTIFSSDMAKPTAIVMRYAKR